MSIELKKNIDWVGFVDWNVRDFHSYDTQRGATYNAYLIRDEKTALIDTVKAPFADFLLRNIREKTDLSNVDYIICNHAELDHSGSLPKLMNALPNATLLCNAKCRETLSGYFDINSWKIKIVSPEDRISFGSRSLSFVNIPMVHWPESMVSYMPEEEILFSNDAFGQHLATSVRFVDQWNLAHVLQEAKSYYANIVTPYGKQVLKTLEAVKTIPIKMIAPSHGLIWRTNISDIISEYLRWASGQYESKMVILYDTMWESTQKMAEEISRGAVDYSDSLEKSANSFDAQSGKSPSSVIDVQLLHIRKTTLTRIATEMLDAATVAIGSSTLNAQMMPQMSAVLTYIKGLKFREKSGFAFGSFGWGPGGPENIQKWFEEVKYPVLCSPIKAKFRPTEEILHQCYEAGKMLAQKTHLLAQNQ